jgi:biotin carboxyl carrier protein
LTGSTQRKITIAGSEHEVFLDEHGVDGFFRIEYDGIPFEVFLGDIKDGNSLALVDGIPLKIGEATRSRGTLNLVVNDKRIQVSFSQARDLNSVIYASMATKTPKHHSSVREHGKVFAHMPGRIVSVKVKLGDSVKIGDPILVLLAMKMENTLVASSTGIIRELPVGVGVSVNKGDLLAVIE